MEQHPSTKKYRESEGAEHQPAPPAQHPSTAKYRGEEEPKKEGE